MVLFHSIIVFTVSFAVVVIVVVTVVIVGC